MNKKMGAGIVQSTMRSIFFRMSSKPEYIYPDDLEQGKRYVIFQSDSFNPLSQESDSDDIPGNRKEIGYFNSFRRIERDGEINFYYKFNNVYSFEEMKELKTEFNVGFYDVLDKLDEIYKDSNIKDLNEKEYDNVIFYTEDGEEDYREIYSFFRLKYDELKEEQEKNIKDARKTIYNQALDSIIPDLKTKDDLLEGKVNLNFAESLEEEKNDKYENPLR